MAKDQTVTLKETVYKLQHSLLEGIKSADQLFVAGSILSRSDYEDVVVERSIANMCGYSLCENSLPLDRPYKGRYRISLKEHKVYDLHETYMFCSSSCLVSSRAFAGSLQEERCAVLDPAKLDEILKKFGDLSLDFEGLGKNGESGLSDLKIQDKGETEVGKVSFEEWIGPSNAIEGYVPQQDRDPKPSLKSHKEGSKATHTKSVSKKDCFFSDTDFVSTVITNDEYSISKAPLALPSTDSDIKLQDQIGKENYKGQEASSSSGKQESSKRVEKSKGRRNKVKDKQVSIQDLPSSSNHTAEVEEITESLKAANLTESLLKPSLKSSGAKRSNRSVTWADEKVDNAGRRNVCEVKKMEETTESHATLQSTKAGDDDGSILRLESAEACAVGLSQAAEAVGSGDAEVNDAMSEAGLIILPSPHDLDQGDNVESDGTVEQESASLEQPMRPGIPKSDLFDPDDSWYDAPPEGFSLELSPFATMWMALFAWFTSSSLAFIYGRDESAHEDYLLVNGREYPRKIVLRDGRSSEIRITAESCLARTFPGLVADFRLPVPVSTIEQVVACLLDTMSFVDALPAFRMKQWQVIALLFIEALSVCRIPTLAPYLSDRRMVLYQVLDGARIGREEYDVMKDLMIPLSRNPGAGSGA